jgi:hypothetical protein
VETEERLAALRVKIIEACANREPLLGLLDRLDAAARERPSALDVEALAFIRALLSSPVWPADEDIPVPRAILTRLTKPDAGEGTER